MPTPVINYAGQPWSAGATWQTNNAGNFGTQEVTDFSNGSGVVLYTGDVVALGSGTNLGLDAGGQPTGFEVTTVAAASSPYVIGVVGGMTNQASAGGPNPFVTPAWRFDSVAVALSATQPDTNAVASDVGKAVIGPGIPSNAYIVSVVPGTSFTMNVAATAAATATLAIGPQIASEGPGWQTTPSFPPGSVLPVVMAGWAYVNVGANTVAAGALLTSSGTARQGSAVASSALLIGTFIGVALEAQNATGTITSGDGSASRLVRAWITKF